MQDMNTAVSRIVQELSKGNLSIHDETMDPDCVNHALPPGMPQNLAATRQNMSMFLTAFPDLAYALEDTVTEGDKICYRVSGRATMKGSLMGMPATGKSASWTEVHIARFSSGKMVEHWAVIDRFAIFQQVGLIPAPGQGRS